MFDEEVQHKGVKRKLSEVFNETKDSLKQRFKQKWSHHSQVLNIQYKPHKVGNRIKAE